MRLIGWNALLLAAGVAMVVLAGEAYFRLTVPFMRSFLPLEFVPNVGYLRPPNTEIRHTNALDFWNVSRTNSLGFLDREPPSPERAKATCHVSIIGDSFVEAREVPIEDKLQVRLEELAADRLPHLDVTTSAFGMSNTGQVHQLPFYDEYARRLYPKMLVLVFVANDFPDNTPVMRSRNLQRIRRKYPLEPFVRKRSDGELELAYPPPPPEQLPRGSLPLASWAARAGREAIAHSFFAVWLYLKTERFIGTVEAQRPRLLPDRAAPFDGWFDDALQYTRFAVEQFKQRADRDGVELVILAMHSFKSHRRIYAFERLSEMAANLGIPIIDQGDYILRQDASLSDAQLRYDGHWNPAGHQWAAEALIEYIEQRPEVCDG